MQAAWYRGVGAELGARYHCVDRDRICRGGICHACVTVTDTTAWTGTGLHTAHATHSLHTAHTTRWIPALELGRDRISVRLTLKVRVAPSLVVMKVMDEGIWGWTANYRALVHEVVQQWAACDESAWQEA